MSSWVYSRVVGLCCSCIYFGVLFFFFFQAEDGIRDLTVTGVQTCALPICFWWANSLNTFTNNVAAGNDLYGFRYEATSSKRSEERRVGKECRSRWSPYH